MKRAHALAALGGFTAVPWTAARAADVPHVLIGMDPIESVANIFVAETQNYFGAANVAVTVQHTNNGAAGAAAVVAGSLDVTLINVASLVSAVQRNVPLVVVGLSEMYSSKTPTTQLLVLGDSPLTAPQQLPGKTIAVNALGGLADIATHLWLAKNGVDAAGVSFIEMPFSVMNDALKSRRVDAIFVTEPGLSAAKHGGARVLANAYDAIATEFLIGAVVSSRTWAARNADTIRRFSSALHRASLWANRHHDETALIASKFINQDVAAIKAETLATFPENESPASLLQPVFDAVAKSKNTAAISAGDVISPALGS